MTVYVYPLVQLPIFLSLLSLLTQRAENEETEKEIEKEKTKKERKTDPKEEEAEVEAGVEVQADRKELRRNVTP